MPSVDQTAAVTRPSALTHPAGYRQVVFEDPGGGERWLCGSIIRTDRTTTFDDGAEHPHDLLDISTCTHPSHTGQMKFIDSAGRVERFNQRYGRRTPPPSTPAN